MPPRLNLKNQTFGYLKAIKPTLLREESNGSVIWECRCICGKFINVPTRCLKSGNTKSCGCKRGELAAINISKANIKHGAAYKPKEGGAQLDYSLWQGIKRRCYNKNDRNYLRYGGRGIYLSSKFKNNFENFALYIRSLVNCPSETMLVSRGLGKRLKVSLDRINNNKSYVTGNLKWSTSVEQARNRKSNVYYKYEGRKVTLAEISELCGVKYSKLHQRINRDGKTLQEAISMG